MKLPNISVVIPVNRREYIEEAIDSVRAQSYQPEEVIIVNDHASDEGPFLAYDYGRRCGLHMVLMRNKRNRGVSGARNIGADYAKTKFVAFLDSDDIWKPDHLKTLAEAVATSNALLACSDFEFFGIPEICERSRLSFKRHKVKMLKKGFKRLGEKLFLSSNNLLYMGLCGSLALRIQGSMISKKIIYDYNIWFDENLRFLEDHQFYLECVYRRLPLVYVNNVGVLIRKHRTDAHYDKVASHTYRMQKLLRDFDCKTMNAHEQEAFHRLTHEMGFLLVKGMVVNGDPVNGEEPPPKHVLARISDSLKFLSQFPTKRGIREAVKNVLGEMSSRSLVCMFKKIPSRSEHKEDLMDSVQLDQELSFLMEK